VGDEYAIEYEIQDVTERHIMYSQTARVESYYTLPEEVSHLREREKSAEAIIAMKPMKMNRAKGGRTNETDN